MKIMNYIFLKRVYERGEKDYGFFYFSALGDIDATVFFIYTN